MLYINCMCTWNVRFNEFFCKTAIEEHYDFGARISFKSYILAAIGTFVISYLVSKFLSRKIRKIDMVTSLKCNE